MRRLLLTACLTAIPLAALAQDRNVITEAVPPAAILSTIDAPIEYDANGVVKAQHFKPEDLTPEQYQALLDEADKIRAYRAHRQTATAPAAPVGQVPAHMPAHTPSPVQTASPTSYTVQVGDTLYNIARRHAVSVTALQQANGIQGSSISIGQSLAIPAAPTRPQSTVSVSETVRDGVVTRRVTRPVPMSRQTRSVDDDTTRTYAVLKKDTLYAISRRTCVDVASLVALNGLENPNALTPGQQLDLPDTHCLAR